MSLLGWGLFGALFGIKDQIDTSRKYKEHQPEAQEFVTQLHKNMADLKALQNKNYVAEMHKDDIVSSTVFVTAKQISADKISLHWKCSLSYSDLAEGFEIHRAYGKQTSQIVTTIPFVERKVFYEYTDTIKPNTEREIQYEIYLYCKYDGIRYRSKCSVGGKIENVFTSLKSNTLHAENKIDGSIKLFWDKQSNVSYYKVFKKSSIEEQFVLLTTLDGNAKHYTDRFVKPNTEYAYYIKAARLYNEHIEEEKDSNLYSIITTEPQKQKISSEAVPKHATKKEISIPDFDKMDGHQFEEFCANLLKSNGFRDVKVTRGSGDQGVDILAKKGQIKYGIQCKCYNSAVGNKAVQEVFSGKTFYNLHVGVVLTNNFFTPSAIELAEKNGVLLWNRKELLSLIKKSNKYNKEDTTND